MRSASSAEPLPVLVIDDDSALIRTLADILRLHGYSPRTAMTGLEGLRLAEHEAPVLAVVDLRLPDMDGVELASRLHALSDLTQVVVLTGNASLESAVAAMREQSIDYLIKPVQIDQLLHVVSVAAERWQRRVAEEKLRASDERFRRVVESDMIGIMFWSVDGSVNDANESFLRTIGQTRRDLEAGAINWRAITPPEYADMQAERERQLREHGVTSPYEKEYVRKDGSRVPVLIGTAMLQGSDQRGVAFVLDISDRKAAERSLQVRARQQESVAEFGRSALGADDMAALLNEAAALVARTLGVPISAVFERRSDDSLALRAAVGFEAAAEPAAVPIADATIGGATLTRSEPVLLRDLHRDARFPDEVQLRAAGVRSVIAVVIPGRVRPFGVLEVGDRRVREFSQDDVHFLTAIAHVLGTTLDRHRTEVALRQTQRLEAVGRLASGVAHDFNNMLSAITAYTEIVLQDTPAGDPHRDDLNEILASAKRAAGLTRQLLAFSRQQVMQPRLLSLNDVVNGMEKMVHRLLGPEIALALRLDRDLEWVKADPGQLEQVILNLCVNARDAMPHGGRLTIETANATLDVDREREHQYVLSRDGDFVMLAVTDTGIGMDADTRARIFEPFFTTKGPEKGTGLGLATVYGIVTQSAGEIFVQSEPGHGTSLKIFLPRCTEIRGGESLVQRPTQTHSNATVLLAEDDETLRRISERILSKAGYTVLSAANGDEALRSIETHTGPIHLLVTDMMMPHIDGVELAQRIREQRPGIGVLFLSGFTSSAMANGLQPGDSFLQKPFGSETLVAKAREALDRRESSA